MTSLVQKNIFKNILRELLSNVWLGTIGLLNNMSPQRHASIDKWRQTRSGVERGHFEHSSVPVLGRSGQN